MIRREEEQQEVNYDDDDDDADDDDGEDEDGDPASHLSSSFDELKINRNFARRHNTPVD